MTQFPGRITTGNKTASCPVSSPDTWRMTIGALTWGSSGIETDLRFTNRPNPRPWQFKISNLESTAAPTQSKIPRTGRRSTCPTMHSKTGLRSLVQRKTFCTNSTSLTTRASWPATSTCSTSRNTPRTSTRSVSRYLNQSQVNMMLRVRQRLHSNQNSRT